MLLETVTPFIRFAGKWEYETKKENAVAYDCRSLYILSGSGKILLDGTAHRIAPGAYFLFQPGTVYSLFPEPVFTAIAVDFDYTSAYAGEASIIIPVKADAFDPAKAHAHITFDDQPCLNSPLAVQNAYPLHRPLSELCEEFEGKRMFYLQKASLLQKSILFDLIRLIQSAGKNSGIAEELIRYLSEHYAERLRGASVSRELHYSAGYLNRVLLASTGKTMHGFLSDLRIRAALRLLASTDLTISDIAFQTGFYSTAHFSNAFKAVTGLSPSAYRRG